MNNQKIASRIMCPGNCHPSSTARESSLELRRRQDKSGITFSCKTKRYKKKPHLVLQRSKTAVSAENFSPTERRELITFPSYIEAIIQIHGVPSYIEGKVIKETEADYLIQTGSGQTISVPKNLVI